MSSIYSNQDSWSQYSFAPCSPCSSGSTFASEETLHLAGPSIESSACLTIFLPNLIDRLQVSVCELEDFVSARLGRRADVSILHLIVYLFFKNIQQDTPNINNVKLIHRGRPYTIQRACDLSTPSPFIKDFIDIFPTFQLVITTTVRCSPLKMPVDAMIQKIGDGTSPATTSSVTYADAMLKLFKSKTRKMSVGSIESQRSTTRYASRDSATDVEEDENSRNKNRLKKSFKRIIHSLRDSAPQDRIAEAFLLSL